MTAVALSAEPKALRRFWQDWRRRATAVEPKTLEEMSREADDLYALHESARNKLVS